MIFKHKKLGHGGEGRIHVLLADKAGVESGGHLTCRAWALSCPPFPVDLRVCYLPEFFQEGRRILINNPAQHAVLQASK